MLILNIRLYLYTWENHKINYIFTSYLENLDWGIRTNAFEKYIQVSQGYPQKLKSIQLVNDLASCILAKQHKLRENPV